MNTKPYWLETVEFPRFSSPRKDIEVDVIVVGGGITGITTAYLMKQAGCTVALVERGRLAHVDTGHTTAHLTGVLDERFHHLARVFGDEAARLAWDGSTEAIAQIGRLVSAENIECGFRAVPGYLHAPVGEPAEKFADELKREFDAARALGIPVDFEDRVAGLSAPGLVFPRQALFHPTRYLAALAAKIPGDGSYVFENTAAGETTEEPLAIEVGAHRITGKKLVLATHNPLVGNDGTMSAMLFQTKLSLYTSYALSARVAGGTFPEASYWDLNDPYYYLRVEGDGPDDLLVFGGEDHKTGQVTDTVAIYEKLESKLREFAPEAVVQHRWSGQVVESNDGLPFIGEKVPHQFVATGFAGNGMTFGTLAAMMAVDWVQGRENPWAELFAVTRRPRGGAWAMVRENKDYPLYLAKDFLTRHESELNTLSSNEGKVMSIDGRRVAVYRSARGQLSMCSAICTHMKCIVAWNNAERTWDCPCHGSRFRPDGSVISGPAEEPLEKIEAK